MWEDIDDSEENKENVPPRMPSPDAVVTPVSSPSPPPEASDPFQQAIEDFEVAKLAAGLTPVDEGEEAEEVPMSLYLGLVLSLLSVCVNVTTVSMPREWREVVGQKVRDAFPKSREVRWTVDGGLDEVETFGGGEEEEEEEEGGVNKGAEYEEV